MLRPTFPLSTDRLILRPFTADDLDDVWAYQRLPEVARYLLWEPRNREQSQVSVEQMATENMLANEGDCLCLAVVWPETGAVVGHVELVWLSEAHRQGEIGYVFNPQYQGKGLATEAVLEMLRLGFDELNLHRIIGQCNAENSSSAKLMERVGMRREAHFVESLMVKGTWRDALIYAMRQPDWQARPTE